MISAYVFHIVALVLVRRTRTTRTGCAHLRTQLSVMTSGVRQIGAADSSSGNKAVIIKPFADSDTRASPATDVGHLPGQ